MPEKTISAKRKNDAVITICQNNDNNSIEIKNLNKAAERLTGYLSEELVSKPLDEILPTDIQEYIKDELEDNVFNEDIATLLRKIRMFKIVNNTGNNIPVSLKVFYLVSNQNNLLEFELLMRDITLLKRLDELKHNVIDSKNENPTYNNTNLVAKDLLLDTIDMIHKFVKEYNVETTIALARIDNFNDYIASLGTNLADNIFVQVGSIIKRTLRDSDIVGVYDDQTLGMAILDCNNDDINTVLNRIINNVTKSPIYPNMNDPEFGVNVTVSFSYKQLSKDNITNLILQNCTKMLDKAQTAGGGKIYEAMQ